MKKTIMVLGLAMCATFAFAQTNQSVKPMRATDVKLAGTDAKPTEANYTGSIFTKAGELFVCEFSTADASLYSTGTIGSGVTIDGVQQPAHGQSLPHSMWARIPDTSDNTINALRSAGNYPVSINYLTSMTSGAWTPFKTVYSSSVDNGFMAMTMYDQVAANGGSGAIGNFDAYIAFASFPTTTATLVDVTFYQTYRRSNREHCYLDYSNDGTTWHSIEFNIRATEIATNSDYRGNRRITLPASMAGQANVYLRLRFACSELAAGFYGYWLMIDDFTVTASPSDRITTKDVTYFEGFYGLLPRKFAVPTVWAASFINDGLNAQNDVTGTLYAWMDGDNASTINSRNIGTVPVDPTTTKILAIDPLRYYDDTSDYHGWSEGWSYSLPASARHRGVGNVSYLPTSEVGTGLYSSSLTTAATGVGRTFDTIAYNVNWKLTEDDSYGIWGRDNGILRKNSRWVAGYTDYQNRVYSTDPQSGIRWSSANYGVMVSYVTGDSIPKDAEGNPWRILGVEMVPSTYSGMRATGAKLEALLYTDSVTDSGRYMRIVGTGASTYTVQPTDLVSIANLEYLKQGNYPTVFIPFPEHPVLRPKMVYRTGYELTEEAAFALAAQTTNFYVNVDGESVPFSSVAGMQEYKTFNGVENTYTTLVIDPAIPTGNYFAASFPVSTYPMIRLVVGPDFYVQRYNITLQCGDNGEFQNSSYNSLCGQTYEVAAGSGYSFYVIPEPDYVPDKVYIDGDTDTLPINRLQDANGDIYGTVSLENIENDHTLRCTFKPKEIGINMVAGVSMKLQPNPATSNVQVSLTGVTGTVNYSLIDMSGRVVMSNSFNAENGTSINVSNLAKGAYFVRITNDKITKVEKLIVR